MSEAEIKAKNDDPELYAVVAWCGKLRFTNGETTTVHALRAVVTKHGPEGAVYTVLERAEKSAMGELSWIRCDTWRVPWMESQKHKFSLSTVVEMLISAAGKRPDWDNRKFEFAQVWPLAEGAPGVSDPLA